MAESRLNLVVGAPPEGYSAVALPLGQGGAGAAGGLRLSVLVKNTPEPVGGSLVVLRELLDARVLLGCLCDAAGRVHQWVEIWVQSDQGLEQAPAGVREVLTPEVRGTRWEQMVGAYDAFERPVLIRTGFESTPAPAMSVEVPAGGGKVEMTSQPARLMVRSFTPHGLEAFAGLLSSPVLSGTRPRVGVPHGKHVIDLDRVFGVSALDGGGLFLGQPGKWGRMIEALHLKLRLLLDCVESVRTLAARTQRPVLNLRPESFQVAIGDAARGLPQWWTARAQVCDPGDAVALPMQTSDASYFLSASMSRPSVYRPESLGLSGGGGRGQLRIRQILTQRGEEIILEGTLVTSERVRMTKHDLVWLRASVGSRRVDLYGRLDGDAALTGGELRLRTLPQRLPADVSASLNAAQGVPLSDVGFEIVPLVSTPCDLYALGVIAVRLLLVGRGTALPVALDEMLSLARAVNQSAGGAGPVSGVTDVSKLVAQVFSSDPRWLPALGPHRLTEEDVTPEQSLDLVPPEVWFGVLGTIVQMFPGLGPVSRARDLGDVRFGGAHLVFDGAVEDLDVLLRRTRSLIVIDWNANREVHSVLRRFATGVGTGG